MVSSSCRESLFVTGGDTQVAEAPWRSIRRVCGNTRFVPDGPNGAEGTTILTVFRDF
jgi:hypothetical protein